MVKKIITFLILATLVSCSSSKPAIATTKKAAMQKTRVATTRKPAYAKPIGKNYPTTNNTTEVIQSTSKTVVTNDLITNYVLQYNTSFTPTEWVNVMVTAQKEISASVENQTDDEITKLTLVRKFESK